MCIRDRLRTHRIDDILHRVRSRRPPVTAPFPDIAADVVQAESVRFIGVNRRRREIAIGLAVLFRKRSLPNVAVVFPARHQLIAPGISVLVEPASCGIFPFRFGWQPGAAPAAKRLCVVPGDVNHRVIEPVIDRRSKTLGLFPRRAIHPEPPLRATRRSSHRHSPHRRQQVKHERPAESLRLGDVPGVLDERRELPVGDSVPADPERAHRDWPHRSLPVSRKALWIVGSHAKGAAINRYEVTQDVLVNVCVTSLLRQLMGYVVMICRCRAYCRALWCTAMSMLFGHGRSLCSAPCRAAHNPALPLTLSRLLLQPPSRQRRPDSGSIAICFLLSITLNYSHISWFLGKLVVKPIHTKLGIFMLDFQNMSQIEQLFDDMEPVNLAGEAFVPSLHAEEIRLDDSEPEAENEEELSSFEDANLGPFQTFGPTEAALPLVAIDAGVLDLGMSRTGFALAFKAAVVEQDVTGTHTVTKIGPQVKFIAPDNRAELLRYVGRSMSNESMFVTMHEDGSCTIKKGATEPNQFKDRIRNFIERMLQVDVVQQLTNGILLVDGALTLRTLNTPQIFLEQLSREAAAHNSEIVGISKKSRITVDGVHIGALLDYDAPDAGYRKTVS